MCEIIFLTQKYHVTVVFFSRIFAFRGRDRRDTVLMYYYYRYL